MLHVAPDHQCAPFRRRDVSANRHIACHAAIAQNKDALSDLLHLVQAVRDIDNPDALLTQGTYRGKKPLDFAVCEGRRRFVQNQDARVAER